MGVSSGYQPIDALDRAVLVKLQRLRYSVIMSSNAKTSRDADIRRQTGADGKTEPAGPTEGKSAKPVSQRPDPSDFVADLLVTDKIILDHLAK
jgi:hypothetical protein